MASNIGRLVHAANMGNPDLMREAIAAAARKYPEGNVRNAFIQHMNQHYMGKCHLINEVAILNAKKGLGDTPLPEIVCNYRKAAKVTKYLKYVDDILRNRPSIIREVPWLNEVTQQLQQRVTEAERNLNNERVENREKEKKLQRLERELVQTKKQLTDWRNHCRTAQRG